MKIHRRRRRQEKLNRLGDHRDQESHKDQGEYDEKELDQPISCDVHENQEFLKGVFKDCSDVVFRPLEVNHRDAFLLYVDGFIDAKSIQFASIFQVLTWTNQQEQCLSFEELKTSIIANVQLAEVERMKDAVTKVMEGSTLLFIDGFEKALVIDAKGWDFRSIAEPETESVIRGPREGFTENLRTNTSMIRRKIRSHRLKMLVMKAGEQTQTILTLVYMEGIVDEEVLKEVQVRLNKIKIDGILESGYIEELIEDSSWTFFPQIQNTERPDTVAANLLEGRIAILVDGTPFALILPISFWQLIQSSEDYYERFFISIFLRWIRYLFLFFSLYLPALYIAISTYHQDLIPTSLLGSIAASREAIPFPAFVEALIMEIAFEALREAGLRLPRTIGSAVSILGALVIGTAAVDAGIVSAPIVIIVSITGIASFIIPRFNAAIPFRLLRFPMMILAAVVGLYGIIVGTVFLAAHLCKLRSFGVPYLAPVTPFSLRDWKDLFIRAPWWSMKYRPKQFTEHLSRREE